MPLWLTRACSTALAWAALTAALMGPAPAVARADTITLTIPNVVVHMVVCRTDAGRVHRSRHCEPAGTYQLNPPYSPGAPVTELTRYVNAPLHPAGRHGPNPHERASHRGSDHH